MSDRFSSESMTVIITQSQRSHISHSSIFAFTHLSQTHCSTNSVSLLRMYCTTSQLPIICYSFIFPDSLFLLYFPTSLCFFSLRQSHFHCFPLPNVYSLLLLTLILSSRSNISGYKHTNSFNRISLLINFSYQTAHKSKSGNEVNLIELNQSASSPSKNHAPTQESY